MTDDPSKVNENDDLEIVEDDQSESDAAGFKLQADGQYGFRFVPEINQTGAYSLRADHDSYEPTNERAQHGSANDAPTIAAPNAAANDIYGVEEPTPLPDYASEVERRNERLHSDADEKNNAKNHKSAFDDFSLSELYERKRVDLAKHENDERVVAKRGELPERPFWDNLLKPFMSASASFRLGLISAFAFIPILLVTHYYTRTLSSEAETMIQNHQELSALTAFLRCIWKDKIIRLLFCLLWGVFSTPYTLHIFTETASGADKFEDWPEYSFLGGLGQFLWLCALIMIGGIPGAALFSVLHLSSLVGFIFSTAFLTPIFFLSCMQTDTYFTLLTKDVARSLKRVRKSWTCFFGITYAFVFGTIAVVVLNIWIAVHNYVVPNPGEKANIGNAVFAAVFLSLAISYIPALYARILGRLAWIIEDDVRKRTEAEQEAEQTE